MRTVRTAGFNFAGRFGRVRDASSGVARSPGIDFGWLKAGCCAVLQIQPVDPPQTAVLGSIMSWVTQVICLLENAVPPKSESHCDGQIKQTIKPVTKRILLA